MHDRQKKCGAEWKEAKAAGKTEKGMTWPKYWSACNKRRKEAAAKKAERYLKQSALRRGCVRLSPDTPRASERLVSLADAL